MLFVTGLMTATAMAALSGTAAADEDESYIAVVTGDNVYVRSGAADSYYPFGRVNSGDLVKVTGEKFNWARVHTTGPTFTPDRFFGYIVYPTTQPGRFRLSADGVTGTTLGRADVLAPNLNTGHNPNDSWKPLIRLDAGTDVTVLETNETANNTVHKIVLPANAEGWISTAYLRPATAEERATFERALEEGAVDEADEREADAEPQPSPRSTPAPSPEPREESSDDGQPSPPRPNAQPTPEVQPAPAETQPAPRESEAPAPEPRDAPRSPREEESLDEPSVMPSLPTSAPESMPQEPAEQQEEQIEPAEPAEPSLAERLADASLEDLEMAYEQLREEAIETAEVEPLREMYLRFVERSSDENAKEASFAKARAEQLALWADVQKQKNELAEIRERARIAADRTEAAQLALDAGGDYVAVGRLAVSTIYDGERLPRMLRIQDPGTGRTVAYVEPGQGYDLVSMLGQLIGVVGDKSYDGGLRLNVVQPRRVDILSPR